MTTMKPPEYTYCTEYPGMYPVSTGRMDLPPNQKAVVWIAQAQYFSIQVYCTATYHS